MDINNIVLGWTRLTCLTAGFRIYKHGDEQPGFIKEEKMLDDVSDCQLRGGWKRPNYI